MAGNFSNQMRALVEKYKDRPEMVLRGVGIKLFAAVVADTPVDTGRLRANWRVSVNAPDRTVDEKEGALSTKLTLTALKAAADGVKANDSFYLSNSLPYVRRIEYEGWSHTKAPLGMVHKNVMRFRALVRGEVSIARR